MKISIRLALISVILGLIWITFVVTTSSTYLSSQQTLREHANDIMQNIAKLAMQEAYTHLNHAQGATVLTRRLLSDDIVGSGNSTVNVLEQYFYNNMAINSHFAGIYLGLPDGSFYDVRRYDGKLKNGFRTKIINKSQDKSTNQTHLIYRDESFVVVMEDDDLDDDYDPRKRPWYIKAVQKRNLVWTDPYIFYSSRKPGITIAAPSFDRDGNIKGVIGVDIEIDQLSTFIAGLKIGKSGKAFMLNRNGDVVAHPDLDKLRSQNLPDNNQYRLVKIDELNDDAGQKAFESLLSATNSKNLKDLDRSMLADFVFDGKTYSSMIAPFTRWEWPWFICVYLPEDDYLGALKANRRINMMITFIISLMATAIGLYLARGIIRPISDLEAEARAIKDDDFDSDTAIPSSYTEIRSTVESFRMMKNAVQTSQRRYRGIFKNIQDVYFEATMDGKIIEVSPSIYKVYGLDRKRLIGKFLVNYFVDKEAFHHLQDILLKSRRCIDFQAELTTKGGKIAHGSINAELITNSQNHPEKMIGSLRDITQRREVERELEQYRKHLEEQIDYRTQDLEETNVELVREIEQRRKITDELRIREKEYYDLYNLNRMVTQNVPDLLWAKDLRGRYIFANQALCDKLLMCGNPEEVMGRSCLFFAQRERELGHEYTFGEICENSDEITLESKKAGRFLEDGLVGGKYLALDVYKTPFIDEKGDIIGTVGCGRDVTKEKAIEKELQNTEERFRELFENTSDLIHSVDRNCNFLMVNNAWLKTLKYGRDEIIGKNLFQIIYRDRHPDCHTLFKDAFRGENLEKIESTFVAKDGEMVHVVGNVTPRVVDGEVVSAQAIFHDITERKKNEKAILYAHAKLEQRVEERTAALTEANELLRIKFKEGKQAKERLGQAYEKLQSTQAQLIQAAKLASIGELASGVAHELNQPLMVIRGNAQMLKKECHINNFFENESGDYIHLIERNTKRMMNIINHLRSFSRQSQLRFSKVDINTVLTDALLMIEEQLRLHKVVLIKRMDSMLPPITGDGNQLEQTFLNLLTNARDAIEIKRDQSVGEANDAVEVSQWISIQTRRAAENDQMVEVLIQDSGCGILPENVANVFDPFFTTKQVGQGTGLGLSISYGIVRDHGGGIEIVNTGKDGTTIRVTLPVQEAIEKMNPMKSKILVVDDEKDVRRTIETALRSESYSVQTAASGKEAIALLEKEPFDLVITDIRMPGTDGVELLRRTKRIDDTIEVIILTGYASIENVIETLRNDGAYDYLTKPLEEIDALLFSVEQALNHRELRVTNDKLTLALQKQNSELKQVQKALMQSEERFRTIATITSDYFYSLSFKDNGTFTIEWIDGAFKRVTGYDRDTLQYFDDWPGLVHPDDRAVFNDAMKRILSNRSNISQYRVSSKDGGERWVRDYSHPIWDKGKNRVVSAIGAVRDITDRVRMEEKLMQEQTFTAIAGLAGGVAHEFNNALFGITGNLELIAMDANEKKAMPPSFQAIESSANRMAELTRQLLAYARGGKYRAREVAFDDFLAQALPLTKHVIHPSIRFETVVPSKMDTITADPTQLQMVLSAILANASESMGGNGTIRLEARSSSTQGRSEDVPSTIADGPYVSLTVMDEGKGMDETTRTRIFEPFFSTKKQGRGLGMAAVYGIVKNHGGDISVKSVPAEGTTVRLFLPARRKSTEIRRDLSGRSPISGGHGTVLIVDDEKVVVDIGRAILKKLGYHVLAATEGKEAKDFFQDVDHQIDLVLLDIKLPDMNGSEVLGYIKKKYPEIKVVVCSGYALDGQDTDLFGLGADGFLQKPYMLSDLSTMIGKLLKS